MWFTQGNKKMLLDLVSSRDPSQVLMLSESDILQGPNDELLFCWEEKPIAGVLLPELILVQQGINDFLAWTATYFPNFKPFTSFCRVMEFETFKKLQAIIDKTSLKSSEKAFEKSFECMCLGLILGEGLTYLGKKPLKKLTPMAIMTIHSFALARSFILGYDKQIQDMISLRWEIIQDKTNQPKKPLKMESLRNLWTLFLSVSDNLPITTDMISEEIMSVHYACQDLRHLGRISENTWQDLTHRKLGTFCLPLMENREWHVRQFQDHLRPIMDSKLSDIKKTFLLSHLVNQIAPGSLQHYELLYSVLPRFPDIMLWYGLLAGISSSVDLYNFEEGLGWRILKELTRHDEFSFEPDTDISFDELDVFLKAQREQHFRTNSNIHYRIELFPNVNTYAVWPSDPIREPESTTTEISLFSDPLAEALKNMNKAMLLLHEEMNNRKPTQKKKRYHSSK